MQIPYSCVFFSPLSRACPFQSFFKLSSKYQDKLHHLLHFHHLHHGTQRGLCSLDCFLSLHQPLCCISHKYSSQYIFAIRKHSTLKLFYTINYRNIRSCSHQIPVTLCHAKCGPSVRDKLFLNQHCRKETTVTVFSYNSSSSTLNMILTQDSTGLLYLIQNFWRKNMFQNPEFGG